MLLSNVEYQVRYIDPSKTTNGAGRYVTDAMNQLPALENNTCYIIRRTAEAKALTLPSGTYNDITNIAFIGMPLSSDELWEQMPSDAKTTWGKDAASYANIEAKVASASLQLPNIQQFKMHRVYLCRNGVDAGAYLLKFNNTSDYIGCFSFEHCKFGSRGVNLDLSSYKTTLESAKLCGYVYIYYARMVSITESIIHHGATGYSSYAHGIYCKFAEIMNVDHVYVYSAAGSSSSNAYPLFLSDASQEGIECNIHDIVQTIRLNGSTGQYVPQLLSVQGYISLKVSDISVQTGDPLSDTKPSSYQIYSALLNFQNVYELSMKYVFLEYNDCWNVRSPALSISRAYTSTYVPGCDKTLNRIGVGLATEDGIGSPVSYENASQSGSSYAAVVLDFSSDTASVRAKAVQVDDIIVRNPRGKALYAEAVRLTNGEFEGSIHLKSTIADVKKLSTWFPGKALNVYDGSHVRVHELICNIENPTYAYNEDPAVGTTFSDNGNVFVVKSNTSLRPMVTQTSKADHIYQGVGCNNEGAEGHFAYRCANGVCDTWSVRRGDGPASLKFMNNTCPGGGTMVLGRKPFNGIEILPTTTGRHILRAHIAFKGFAKKEDLYRHFIISAEVGGKTYYSTVNGVWADNDASIWVNDSDLEQYLLAIPIDIKEVSPVNVRVYFSWYSAGGFVYLDPDIELAKV